MQIVNRLVAAALRLSIVRAYLRYLEHRGPSLADAVSYRALFSVFAALLLIFTVAAFWLAGDPAALATLLRTIDTMIPGLTDTFDIEHITVPSTFSLLGVASFLGLIGAAIGAIASLRFALRTIADRGFAEDPPLKAIPQNLLVACAFGGLLIVAAVLSVAGSFGLETVATWFGASLRSTWLSVLSRVLGIVIVFTIDTVAIALMFRVLAGVAAPARVLWQGAALGGIGLVSLQELSGLFVRGATANPLLATFSALIALLIWFNLSAQLVLIMSSFIIVKTEEARDRVRERYGASTLLQLRRRRAENRLHAATLALREAQEAERTEQSKKKTPSGGE